MKKPIKMILSITIIVCIFVVIMAIISPKSETDKNLTRVEQGLMSKVSYQGHTYIVWSVNLGGGMTHDPDCNCRGK